MLTKTEGILARLLVGSYGRLEYKLHVFDNEGHKHYYDTVLK